MAAIIRTLCHCRHIDTTGVGHTVELATEPFWDEIAPTSWQSV